MGNLIWVAAGAAAAKKRNGSSSGGGGGGDDDGLILLLFLLLIIISPMIFFFVVVLWPLITLVITILFARFIRGAVKEAKGLSQDEKSKLKKRCIVRAIGYVVTLLLNIPWWIWALPNL